MRIGATYSQTGSATQAAEGAAEAAKGRRGTGASAETPPGADGGVRVTLSDKARELDKAQAPETSEKVQRLQAAVQSGQLPVDADAIAAAIVGD